MPTITVPLNVITLVTESHQCEGTRTPNWINCGYAALCRQDVKRTVWALILVPDSDGVK